MGELTMGLDWLAVGISTVLSFVLGALWFSKTMFGVKWAAGRAVEMGDGSTLPVAALVLQLLGTFLFAWLIGIAAAASALLIALMIAVAICALLMASCFFGGNSRYAAVAEGAFVMTMFAIMLLCQVVL